MNKRSNRSDEQKEPWEQPIYEEETQENASRSNQYHQKRGNTLFLSIVLFLLFLCVAIPTVVGIWVHQQKTEAASLVSSSSSEVAKASSSTTTTTKTSSTETESTSSTEMTSETVGETQTEETLPSSDESSQVSVPEETTPSSSAVAGETIEVLSGEGPNQIAARAGISVEKLLQLNGMSMDNFFFAPGQQVRIK
ncbi:MULTISPECIES: SAG1386/EF1546 family surface-associated protein [Enterococcus]|uniref:LysM domain-containing protein n=1 Tax=Enterococcus sulfureus ATCC 49903 TaxID=1140003 RepID=S0KT79_9ENTE|nr:SAG1386/EF1546 family surface-associated protein [Enterococcus sulfureus]EOT47994.1 hypothetical protein OMY_00801 [Enterococcus sulfureus ATCC 49903]EOT84150.1 hypothetical protein I573_01877 [Enterococcus sulfureus ATCC 49903]